MYITYYNSPIGKLTLAVEHQHLTHIFFENQEIPFAFTEQSTSIHEMAIAQLDEYFRLQRTIFDLPIKPKGTPFQLKVWNALLNIPYGNTCSYKDVAININNPKACRAVGMANNKNPLSIIIPCHRVIAQNGNLQGYGGGLPIKTFLLNLEQKKTERI